MLVMTEENPRQEGPTHTVGLTRQSVSFHRFLPSTSSVNRLYVAARAPHPRRNQQAAAPCIIRSGYSDRTEDCGSQSSKWKSVPPHAWTELCGDVRVEMKGRRS